MVLILQLLLIIADYRQQYISSGSKIISDDSLEPLLMIFSVVVRRTNY
jgi:hypothetical protein